MIWSLRASVAIAIAQLANLHFCAAADLQAVVLDAAGQPVPSVVLVATPINPVTPLRPAQSASAQTSGTNASPAIMDQINKEFVPEVLVIRAGTLVLFPNSDSVAHQVYSFSPAKRFALPLYRGRQYPPVAFDQPGIVTLGCNIHDHMVGYIVVTESPYFAQTDAQGRATLRTLPIGTYRISAWHPRFSEQVSEQSITVVDTLEMAITFHLSKSLRPSRRISNDRRIRDY
jgi:plastocyanin